MDQFMVDVTEIPEAKELEEVTLMGRDGEEVLSVDDHFRAGRQIPL